MQEDFFSISCDGWKRIIRRIYKDKQICFLLINYDTKGKLIDYCNQERYLFKEQLGFILRKIFVFDIPSSLM